MTDRARIRIAATVTALFLAAISAVGLATHRDTPAPAPTATAVKQSTLAPTAPPASGEEHGDEAGEEHEIDD